MMSILKNLNVITFFLLYSPFIGGGVLKKKGFQYTKEQIFDSQYLVYAIILSTLTEYVLYYLELFNFKNLIDNYNLLGIRLVLVIITFFFGFVLYVFKKQLMKNTNYKNAEVNGFTRKTIRLVRSNGKLFFLVLVIVIFIPIFYLLW